jgi:hypothetical protein
MKKPNPSTGWLGVVTCGKKDTKSLAILPILVQILGQFVRGGWYNWIS